MATQDYIGNEVPLVTALGSLLENEDLLEIHWDSDGPFEGGPEWRVVLPALTEDWVSAPSLQEALEKAVKLAAAVFAEDQDAIDELVPYEQSRES